MPNILKGLVTKTGAMSKTITVTIERRYEHPILLKQMLKHKKMLVHDEEEKAKLGDVVTIIHGKPFSPRKHFRLYSIDKAIADSARTTRSSDSLVEGKVDGIPERIGDILERAASQDEGVASDSERRL